MSVWLTYSLSDFLLFAPRTYYRLFELYNLAVWPAHLLAGALGFTLLMLMRYGGAWRGRAIAAILALFWLWVAWAYLFERYGTINWMAYYFAMGFAVEAILLIISGIVLNRLTPSTDLTSRAGIAIVVFALLIQPLSAPLFGREWIQVEILGIAPDPTVAASIGALLAMLRVHWHLLVIPLLWCAITGTTLWAMEAPDALLMPAIAIFAIGLGAWKTLTRGAVS